MPLPFSLPQRPSLPSLSWATGSSNAPKPDDKTPHSAPPRTSLSSAASSSKRLSSRSIKHTSIIVSRPTTPANPSPLSPGFGLPAQEEDDPFGVLALQKAGLHIKEAGTNNRPGSDAFQYRPAPNSPVWRSSMTSAASRASRPSMDGRSSILPGRRSYAHSRHGSTATTGTNDMSTQTIDFDALDAKSLRTMSPTRDKNPSRQSSPDSTTKRASQTLQNTKPEPLMPKDNDQKRIDESPSPRTKLAVVNEDELETDPQPAKSTMTTESDLDALARELRAMADGHNEDVKKSQEFAKDTRMDSTGDAETIAGDEGDDSEDAKTPQRLSVSTLSGPVGKEAEVEEITAKDLSDTVVVHDELDPAEDQDSDEDDNDEDGYDSFDDDEEPVIIEQAVQTVAPVNVRPRHLGTASMQARAQIVSVHLPPPPQVPSRNPRRTRQFDASELTSPSESVEGDDEQPRSPSSQGDSTSSYSLDHDRYSFDDHQEIMTQTSQGSEAGSTEVTPTHSKTFKFASEDMERSLSDKMSTMSVEELPEHGVQTDSQECAINSSANVEPLTEPTSSPKTDSEDVEGKSDAALLAPPKPAIPERRRPFSFEVGGSEETIDKPSLDAVVLSDPKPEKQPSPKPEMKHTAGQSIQVPSLPEDDGSIYEEDFS